MIKIIRIIFISLYLLTAQINLFAGTTGKISGKVTDKKTGEPLIGVNIILLGTTMGSATDVDGSFYILNIPPGSYKIKASLVGYAAVTFDNVNISVDQTTKLDFQMSEEAIEINNVVVTASKPLVQKDLTSTQENVSGKDIEMLPVEDVQSVINLQAGVVNGHFRGGRLGEVKYMIDGVSVNDVYSGESTMQADVNSIQELQVITGTFNAEYGEALSGVVNQVTKIAGDHYNGSFSAYSGDYATNRRGDLYLYMGGLHPARTYNLQGNISGPVPGTSEFIKFFASGRYLSDDGYLYGKRIFNPSDSSDFTANNSADWYVGSTGDSSNIPMNYSRELTLQGKLSFKVGQGKGIVLEGLYQDHNYKDYDHLFKLNPDGDYNKYQTSFLGSISYTHVFSNAAFLDVLGSAYYSDFQQYVYPLLNASGNEVNFHAGNSISGLHPDPRYVKPERLRDVSGNSFLTGGTENWQFYHNTKSYSGKLDFTDQINNTNEIKTGVEAKLHTLNYTDFEVLVEPSNGYIPHLPDPGSFDFNIYKNHPYQFAAYIQDKIELDYLIVNVGVRYDYFQPDGQVLLNPDSIAVLDDLKPPFPTQYFKKASSESQISPRVGISYPISEKGAVHISYGHFFQIPPFEFLYKNPNYRIALSGDLPELIGNAIGNADLKPQQTVMYELGLQQELTPELGVNVTAYYKDIRNLLGVEIHIKNNFKKFAEYVNRDYGSVTGVTLSLEKRFQDGLGASIDYTYQVAKGSASDPNAAFNKAQSSPPIEENKVLVPLDWDRKHSLNFTLTLGDPNSFIASGVGKLGSGLPYTPSFENQRTGLENSSNKPTYFNVDLYLTKYFTITGINLSVFLKVYNLFDTANELDVFTDTGRAGYTLDLTRAQSAPRGVNTLQQFFNRPDFYSSPRQIILGASIDF